MSFLQARFQRSLAGILLGTGAAISLAVSVSMMPVGAQGASVNDVDLLRDPDAMRKLNYVDRQRMLTQLTAKSACFNALNVDAKAHRQIVLAAQWLFGGALLQLQAGISTFKLEPDQRQPVQSRADDLALAWIDYADAINEWADSEDASTELAERVYELNGPLLEQLDGTVQDFQNAYSAAAETKPQSAKALLASGRQRMLSQKMSKEFCLIAAGQDIEKNRAQLRETMSAFEATAVAMGKGSPEVGLAEPPVGEIVDQIAMAQKIYEEIKPHLSAALAGEQPTPEALQQISRANLRLLRSWDNIAQYFEIL